MGCPLRVSSRHTGSVFAPSSKARLTRYDLGRFQGDSHFHRIARVVCEAGCLPRKELFEAWEVARRHPSPLPWRPHRRSLCRAWPARPDHAAARRLVARSAHRGPGAAGVVLDHRAKFGERVAETPESCQVAGGAAFECRARRGRPGGVDSRLRRPHRPCDRPGRGRAFTVGGDAVLPRSRHSRLRRADRVDGWPAGGGCRPGRKLRAAGWQVWTQTIPAEITPHNRLLLAAP